MKLNIFLALIWTTLISLYFGFNRSKTLDTLPGVNRFFSHISNGSWSMAVIHMWRIVNTFYFIRRPFSFWKCQHLQFPYRSKSIVSIFCLNLHDILIFRTFLYRWFLVVFLCYCCLAFMWCNRFSFCVYVTCFSLLPTHPESSVALRYIISVVQILIYECILV